MTWNSVVLIARTIRAHWAEATVSERSLFVMLDLMSWLTLILAVRAALVGQSNFEPLVWGLLSVFLGTCSLLVALAHVERVAQAQLTRSYLEQYDGEHVLHIDGRKVAEYDGGRWRAFDA